MDLITAHRLRFPSQSAIVRTMFVVRDIGTAAHTTSGDQDIGRGDMVARFGFTAITLCGGTNGFGARRRLLALSLPGGDQSTDQTQGCSHDHFQNVVAF